MEKQTEQVILLKDFQSIFPRITQNPIQTQHDKITATNNLSVHIRHDQIKHHSQSEECVGGACLTLSEWINT